MLLVLIAIAFATILGMSFLAAQSTTTQVGQNVQHHGRARHIAESGLVMAIEQVRQDSDWRSNFSDGVWASNQAFESGTFTVTGRDGYDSDGDGQIDGDGKLNDDNSDKLTLLARGEYNGVTHEVSAVITPRAKNETTILLVVKDPSNMATEDKAKKSLFEEWGYDVDVLDQRASASEYDEAADEADVAYISERAESGNVDTKLTYATIGVVNEEGYLNDALGLSSHNGYDFTADRIRITDNSHFITQPFSEGPLIILDDNQRLRRHVGQLGDGAQVLGRRRHAHTPTLAVIEAGGQTRDHGGAAGRRVFLPWGGSHFDVNKLNADGEKLLKRALNWAATRPDGWRSIDIGDYRPAGSDSRRNGDFIVKAGGDDIWNRSDEFRYVYQTLDGDGTLTAKVTQVPQTDDWSKAGVMVRERLTDDSRHAMMVVTDERGTAFQRRERTGRWSGHTGSSGEVPYWVRIERKGNTLRGYKSKSGSEGSWQQIGPDLTLNNLPQTVFIGMCVTAHHNGRRGTARFEQVSLETTGDNGEPAPKLITLYDFKNNRVTPELLHRWTLDESTGTGGKSTPGLAVGGDIRLWSHAEVKGYDPDADGGSNSGGHPGKGKGPGKGKKHKDKGRGPGNKQSEPASAGKIAISTNRTGWGSIRMSSHAKVDGDAYVGPNGNPSSDIVTWSKSEIDGDEKTLGEKITLTRPTAPGNMPASSGNLYLNAHSEHTISTDKHFGQVRLWSQSELKIDGHVRMLVDGDFRMSSHTELKIEDDSSLALYVKGDLHLSSHSEMNTHNKGDPSALQIYMIGHHQTVALQSHTKLNGKVHSKDADLKVRSHADFKGTFQGDEVRGSSHADIYLPVGGSGGGGGTTTASDEKGKADGTYTNGPVGDKNGQVGTAVSFDGKDDYVVIPHKSDMLLDQGTVSFWFKTDKKAATQGLFSKDSMSYDNGGHLHIYTEGGRVEARLQSTSESHIVQSSPILENDKWFHVALSFGAGGLRLFVNGSEVDDSDYVGGLGQTSGGSGNKEPIVLGASATQSNDQSATPVQNHFSGTLDDVRFYDLAMNNTQIAQVKGDNTPGQRDSYMVNDTSGYKTPVDLAMTDPARTNWLSGGGLALTQATRIISPLAATKLHDTLTETDQVTVELRFRTDSLGHTGPARIASYSAGTGSRNFTVGQSRKRYVSRLRTSDTNSNGTPDMQSPEALNLSKVHHVIVTFDGEEVRLYRDGSREETVSRGGDLDNWDKTMRFMLGNETTDNRPWTGKLHRVAIYDRAFNDIQAGNVFDGKEPGTGTSKDQQFSVRWVEP